jgi:hypothetical protein
VFQLRDISKVVSAVYDLELFKEAGKGVAHGSADDAKMLLTFKGHSDSNARESIPLRRKINYIDGYLSLKFVLDRISLYIYRLSGKS